jgi:CheY-like chemotaxis protein
MMVMNKTDAKIKVLLVEDENIPQMIANYMLRECNCEVDVTKTGQEALEKSLSNNYKIIFMDVGLSDLTGFDVAKKIRENGNNVMIIALTAHCDEDTKKQCLSAGMNSFLIKPLTFEKIQEILDKFT